GHSYNKSASSGVIRSPARILSVSASLLIETIARIYTSDFNSAQAFAASSRDAFVFLSGERTRPRVLIAAPRRNALERQKFAMARAPSPARETRALTGGDGVLSHTHPRLVLFSP